MEIRFLKLIAQPVVRPNNDGNGNANNDVTSNIHFSDIMGAKVVIYFRSQSTEISKFTLDQLKQKKVTPAVCLLHS